MTASRPVSASPLRTSASGCRSADNSIDPPRSFGERGGLRLTRGDNGTRAPRRKRCAAVISELLRQLVDDVPRRGEAAKPNAQCAMQSQRDQLVPLKCVRRSSYTPSSIARWLVAKRPAKRNTLRSVSVRSGRLGRLLQRAHRVFGEAVVDGALIADRHAAAALVVEAIRSRTNSINRGDSTPTSRSAPVTAPTAAATSDRRDMMPATPVDAIALVEVNCGKSGKSLGRFDTCA